LVEFVGAVLRLRLVLVTRDGRKYGVAVGRVR
jgi:hypothetical protein